MVLNIFGLCLCLLVGTGLVVRTYQYVWFGIFADQNYERVSASCMNLPSYNALNYEAMGPGDRKLFGVQPRQ
jgi:hypothetical protein